MRFNSPDSESPFEQGGVNPYAYCEGNPVDYVDPEGRWRLLPLAVTKFFGRLFGKTTATGAKASGSAAKAGQGPASSGGALSRSKNAGGQVSRTTGNAVSDGGKIQPPGAIKNGRAKNGFWDNLENKNIKLEQGKITSEGLRRNPDVKGPKMQDALERPRSGWERFQHKLEKPTASKSMFESSVKDIRFSQQQEASQALRGHWVPRKK